MQKTFRTFLPLGQKRKTMITAFMVQMNSFFSREEAGTMAKKRLDFDEIMALAETYGVKDNVLFVSAADRYAGQIKIIQEMQESVAGGLLMKSVGSMGQEKTETNPLVIQLPKYNDTANKTLSIMLDIIGKLGTAAPVGDKLGDFLNG